MKLNDLFQTLIHNWPIKVLSLLTALLLYMLAQNAGLVERELHTDITIRTPPGLELVEPVSREAQVTLRGPREQIYAVRPDQIKLAADFTHISEPGTYRVQIHIYDIDVSDLVSPLEIDYQPKQLQARFGYSEE